jgi:hypothetical protein
MVTSVPWQLESSKRVNRRPETPPGSSRRGYESVPPREAIPPTPSPATPGGRS